MESLEQPLEITSQEVPGKPAGEISEWISCATARENL